MSEYTQGVCHDGAAILKDGQPLTIEQIIEELRERDALAAHVERLEQIGDAADMCAFGITRESELWIQAREESPSISLQRRDALNQSEGLHKAALFIDQKADAYNAEYGSTDPTTGTREYPGDGAEYYNELIELADELRQQAEGHQ